MPGRAGGRPARRRAGGAGQPLEPPYRAPLTRTTAHTPVGAQALCRAGKLPPALQLALLEPAPAAAHGATLAACGLPAGLLGALQRQHNASQQAAIAGALAGAHQFALIQVTRPPPSRNPPKFTMMARA